MILACIFLGGGRHLCLVLVSEWTWPCRIRLQRRQWQPTPVLLPEKSHGRRSLVGCRPWGRWESDTTERIHFHFPLSCIGEGNGNPLQCSCLENPRDGGAWWATVYGVTQSQTRLKQLSSSSRIRLRVFLPPQFSERVWAGNVLAFLETYGRICWWSHLALGFCLLKDLLLQFRFLCL